MEAATYGLYLLISLFTLVVVATVTRNTGRMLLADAYDGDEARASTVATTLAVIVGLFNLAVIALTIDAETPLATGDQVFDAIATRFGRATLFMAVLFGILLLFLLGARNSRATARAQAEFWAAHPMPNQFVPMVAAGAFIPGPFAQTQGPFGGLPGQSAPYPVAPYPGHFGATATPGPSDPNGMPAR